MALTPLPAEFEMEEHEHGHEEETSKDFMPILLVALIAIPIIWYSVHKKREVTVQ